MPNGMNARPGRAALPFTARAQPLGRGAGLDDRRPVQGHARKIVTQGRPSLLVD